MPFPVKKPHVASPFSPPLSAKTRVTVYGRPVHSARRVASHRLQDCPQKRANRNFCGRASSPGNPSIAPRISQWCTDLQMKLLIRGSVPGILRTITVACRDPASSAIVQRRFRSVGPLMQIWQQACRPVPARLGFGPRVARQFRTVSCVPDLTSVFFAAGREQL